MRISRFTRLTACLLCVMLALVPAAGLAVPSSLTCAIVAKDDLELRPLELNQRDVVSVLDLVYEGLFQMDDNDQPQPELAYSYEFTNDGRKLKVKLRENVTFHNGRTLTSADVIATLDYMFELTGFDDELNSDVPTADRGLYYSTFYSIKSWKRRMTTTSSLPCAAQATARCMPSPSRFCPPTRCATICPRVPARISTTAMSRVRPSG